MKPFFVNILSDDVIVSMTLTGWRPGNSRQQHFPKEQQEVSNHKADGKTRLTQCCWDESINCPTDDSSFKDFWINAGNILFGGLDEKVHPRLVQTSVPV